MTAETMANVREHGGSADGQMAPPTDTVAIVPLRRSIALAHVRQTIEQHQQQRKTISSPSDVSLTLLPAMGESVTSGAIRIRGSESEEVSRTRHLLSRPLRQHSGRIHYESLPATEASVRVAELASGEHWPVPPFEEAPVEEIITGELPTLERAQLRCMRSRLESMGICVREFHLPLSVAGALVGLGGRDRWRFYIDHGILVDVAGRIVNESDSTGEFESPFTFTATTTTTTTTMMCAVFVSAASEEQAERGERMVNEYCASLSVGSESISMPPYLIDYLQTYRQEAIQSICQEYGVAILFRADAIILWGAKSDAIRLARRTLLGQTYDCHQATLWLSARDIGQVEALLTRIVLACGVEVSMQRAGDFATGASTTTSAPPINDGELVVNLHGPQEALEGALMRLAEGLLLTCGLLQIKYSQYQSKSIREFVSGKKDGKLIKIMKETGVSLSLHPATMSDGSPMDSRSGYGKDDDNSDHESDHGHGHGNDSDSDSDIIIELVGGEIGAVLRALTMLVGEFPAETCFYIGEQHHKRLIGHGGATIQRVMKRHAVYIKFLGATEAIHFAGMELGGILPRAHLNRLSNVIIRTPTKNKATLPAAREEILMMANEQRELEQECPLTEHQLCLSRLALLRICPEERTKIKTFLVQYKDCIDVRTTSNHNEAGGVDDLLASHVRLVLAGYGQAMRRFLEALEIGGEQGGISLKAASIGIGSGPTLTLPTAETGVPSPLLSPTTSALSSISTTNSSALSWTSESPDLFRHFNRAVLPPVPQSPSLRMISQLDSPLLGGGEEAAAANLVLPAAGKEFSPVVGLGKGTRTKSLWNVGFPKLSLVDTITQRMTSEEDEVDGRGMNDDEGDAGVFLNWKTISAEHYRRRATLVFRV